MIDAVDISKLGVSERHNVPNIDLNLDTYSFEFLRVDETTDEV